MAELDAWLADPRDYDRRHGTAWRSMLVDLHRALDTRGPRLRQRTPALDELRDETSTPELGDNDAAREGCRELAERGLRQLAEPAAAVAAFDDLHVLIKDPANSEELVRDRIQVLDDALQSAGRSLASEGTSLAGVMDNDAFQINFTHHVLDGISLEEGRADFDEDAGLSLEERLELCRRLLRHAPSRGHHIVWLGYERAKCRFDWVLPIGPVTFFDGPVLAGALEQLSEDRAAGRSSHLPSVLPAELLAEDDSWLSGWFERIRPREEIREWVAVRVDLGSGTYAEPVASAQRQTEALVKLAGFHSGGTSWRQLNGAFQLVDSVPRQEQRFAPPIEQGTWTDHTDETLHELGPDLADHLPVNDPRLLELLEAAAVVEAHGDDDADPTTLVNDVRVIELLASRCSLEWWRHLKTTFAIDWARRCILDEIYGAVAGLRASIELHDIKSVPQPEQLLEAVPGNHRRIWIRYDVALAALPLLVQDLPPHATGARRVRAVAKRTRNPRQLRRWVNELVDEYGRRVERLARCRDSLAHGGPINLDAAATVKRFANAQAGQTTSLGLWAVIRDQGVREAHQQHRASGEAWRQRISSATTVLEALELRDGSQSAAPKEQGA